MATDLLSGASIGGFVSGFIPQMILGRFLFTLNTAAFQEMRRSTSWRWAAQQRIGQMDALQYVGPGEDTITLPGIIYPAWRGGTGQIDGMRALAGQAKPMTLVDATGNVYGRWVIERVEETRSAFAGLGIPQKQEFTLALRHYDGAGHNALLSMLSQLTGYDIQGALSSLTLPDLTGSL